MKLRNKKTGDIADSLWSEDLTGLIHVKSNVTQKLYSSLAELNEDWEDYEPKEPLIKDEKIRKAVRAWAEANSLKIVAFEDYDDENIYFIDRDCEPQIWFSKKSMLGSFLNDGRIYTIAELCGEEE